MKNVDDICNEIKYFSKYQYAKGVCDVLNLLNEKYIIKVWDKKDAEKFFDDVLDTLRDLNIRFVECSRFRERSDFAEFKTE